MENQKNNPHKRQCKFKDYESQKKTISHYLKNDTATASMVSAATGIPQKNICRYKRDLEISGRLWETEKGLCKHTGFRAWYLTTNENLAPFDNQLKMF
jgi:hypothetical protein